MATAWVQGKFAFTDNTGQASKAVTFTSNVTAGSVIAVFIKYGTATSVFGSITDSQGNTYNAVDSIAGGLAGANTVKSFYAYNCAAGATTVTLNFTGSTGVYPRILVEELSGCHTSSTAVLNANEIANQSPTVANSTDSLSSAGSASTTQDGCIIVGFNQNHTDANCAGTAGTNFTVRTAGDTPSSNFDVSRSETRVQASSGSVHAVFTPSAAPGATQYFTTVMMAFAPPITSSATTQSHGFVSG